ncbi:hypothetical protein CRM22_003645 [Opisthorchis felineus]|uniref:Uncharacterized protein n=1 Tax=Opisthorchis felineus TaxID=147828 RepID=A0A4S2M0W3_OPIFE|nr:hypothetical protein CRM22_003645 [Opisthorchis felineus]
MYKLFEWLLHSPTAFDVDYTHASDIAHTPSFLLSLSHTRTLCYAFFDALRKQSTCLHSYVVMVARFTYQSPFFIQCRFGSLQTIRVPPLFSAVTLILHVSVPCLRAPHHLFQYPLVVS